MAILLQYSFFILSQQHGPRKHEVRESIDTPLFQLLTCTKHVYCRVWVTIMHHQRHHHHSIHYAYKIVTFMSYNPVSRAAAERSFSARRTLRTFTRTTTNASNLAHLALLHFHQGTDQTWSCRDLSLGLETSRDLFLQVLVSVFGLEPRSLGLGLGLGTLESRSRSRSWDRTWDHGDSVFVTHEA